MQKLECIRNYLSSVIFLLIFLLLISIPGLMTLLKLYTGKDLDRQLNGHFDPVEAPILNKNSVLNKSFQHGFEDYFHNSFTGRGYLITTYNQIRHSLFGENSQSCIGDSLIYEPYIVAHLGVYPYDYNTPERLAEMKAYVDKLDAISNMLKRRGKSLIVVSASGKAAWFEDDIPRRYFLMPHGLSVSDCLNNVIAEKDILYLDCDSYIKNIDFPYPVFYKSSHHWSRTAEIEIENAIFNIINSRTPFSVETYDIKAVIESDVPIDRDADTWSLMNLWIPTDETYYTYDIDINTVSESTNICIQGDSFSELISRDLVQNGHNGTVSNISYDNVYYVNGECVTLLEHDFSILDMNELVNENDIFIILYTDYNLLGYGVGFVDALYNCLGGAAGGI